MDYNAPDDPFIGRKHEIDIYERWLRDPNAPRILHFYDAASEPDKKGGVGKTKLLQRCIEITNKQYNITTVNVDFFSITDRNGQAIAERVYAQLKATYPDWQANSFDTALREEAGRQYRRAIKKESQNTPNPAETRNILAEALIADLQELDAYLAQTHSATHCALVVFFDTFEVVQENPSIAVFSPLKTFPDDYNFSRIRFVMAGRNDIKWTQANWAGRENEVVSIALEPFSQDDMIDFMNAYEIPLELGSPQAVILHELTDGRPILLGLVKDLLVLHVLTLEVLLSVRPARFEMYLVSQINNFDEPTNWFLLFMAHAYHRFNLALMKWLLREARLQAFIGKIDEKRLNHLPNLSFVRRAADESSDFTLHDEMRFLINKYCWQNLDPDRSFRGEVSRCLIRYCEDALEGKGNE